MKHPKATYANGDPSIANPFLSTLSGPMAGAVGRGASMLGRSVGTLQQESLRFMTRRFEQNIKAVEQFGACKSLPDLFAAQQKWLAETTRAYSEEWARCGELMTEMLHESSDEGSHGRGSKRSETPHRADVREH